MALLALPAQPALAQRRTQASPTFERVAAQAEQARNENRVDEAIELYHRAVKMRPRWAEGWWYLGTLLYERNAFTDAAVAFGKATELSPKVGSAWAMLGLCEFWLDRFDDALAHIQRGRQLGTDAEPQLKSVTIYHEGLLLLGKGEFERAQETLAVLSQDGIEDDTLLVALGLAVLRMRFSELLAGDAPLRDLVRRAGQAESLAARKRFDEARSAYERLAADFPKTPGVQFAFGRFLLASNEVETAVEAFDRELENAPDSVMAHLEVADARLRLRDFAGALPHAEKVVKLSPNSPVGHFLLGVCLLEAKQTARAIAELEISRRSLPNEPKVHFQLGRAYAQAGREADAARARAAFARLTKQQESAPIQSQP